MLTDVFIDILLIGEPKNWIKIMTTHEKKRKKPIRWVPSHLIWNTYIWKKKLILIIFEYNFHTDKITKLFAYNIIFEQIGTKWFCEKLVQKTYQPIYSKVKVKRKER